MTKYNSYFISFFSLIISISACSTKEQADAIFTNGKIYTVNNDFQIAQAMAIRDGKIIAIGEDGEILNYYEAEQTTNLSGLTVYPGFIDGHTHFSWYAEGLQNVDLAGATSFTAVVKRIQKHIEQYPQQKWVVGHGWDQNLWVDKKFPNKDTLDLLFPNKIIVLTRIGGHTLLTNQNGLAAAGFNSYTQIAGDEIVKSQGKPTGILTGDAFFKVYDKIPEVPLGVKKALLQQAESNCFAVGLTSLAEAGVDKSEVDLLDQMQRDSALQIRIYAMLKPNSDNIDYYFSNGHYKTDRMNVRSFKAFADGSLGSRSACLLKPYHDEADHYGKLLIKPENLDSLAADLALKNFQLNTHAIGDSTNRLISNIYAKHLKGKNDKRWRIEHAQIIQHRDIHKFGQYNILPSVQPTHATSDMKWLQERLGPERVQDAYRFKTLLEENKKLIIGTDFPVEAINPIYSFHAAVSRQNANNLPAEGFQINEAISRKEALQGMTIWAAFGQFEEDEKGSLEVGKFADFVILDQDIMEVDTEALRATKVMQTYIGGVKVHQLK